VLELGWNKSRHPPLAYPWPTLRVIGQTDMGATAITPEVSTGTVSPLNGTRSFSHMVYSETILCCILLVSFDSVYLIACHKVLIYFEMAFGCVFDKITYCTIGSRKATYPFITAVTVCYRKCVS
jgi:hypothetical protein